MLGSNILQILNGSEDRKTNPYSGICVPEDETLQLLGKKGPNLSAYYYRDSSTNRVIVGTECWSLGQQVGCLEAVRI
jgi:hypothetical protein